MSHMPFSIDRPNWSSKSDNAQTRRGLIREEFTWN